MNFIKVCAACPETNVSDINFNLTNIYKCIEDAISLECKVVVFPELCITSYTCADLFNQQLLIKESENALNRICTYSINKDILIAVGGPLKFDNCLYNCAFIILNGKILGIVPKSYIPNYTEYYEKRWFTEGYNIKNKMCNLDFQCDIPFGSNLIFTYDNIKFGFEICEDLWSVIPPSSYLSLNGANIICNLSSSNEIISKADYRKKLVASQSARCMCSYVYASSGVHESTTDLVFSGHLLISENGSILNENKRFERNNNIIASIIDIDKLNNERMKNISFRDNSIHAKSEYSEINFELKDVSINNFDRYIDKHPFVPSDKNERDKRCMEIFDIQSSGLAKRIEHTKLTKAVIGISGGLDSTLALISIVKTFKLLSIPFKNIIAVTMPGFGTTDRTYNNAVTLCKKYGCDLREINIVPACLLHFKDIDHDAAIHDVTYENVQARERTQILMDIANKEGGLLVGTGDLSELALGWCTYNGDHMSMYALNCSVPKTLVRYLVEYASICEKDKEVSEILLDILDTPVSPELLPKDKEGNISQKTESIIGPYELHDFFLYYFIRYGMTPQKIIFLAHNAFKDDYSVDEIKKWFALFIKRFFSQQFKRSAIPDGPKIGSVSLSPRGDFRMPSDASSSLWAFR